MKSSYKKAMIALGLIAAVLLLYKYSKVIDGFESGDTFVSISKTYIEDAKKTAENDNKNMNKLIKEYKTEDTNLKTQLDNLLSSEDTILKKYTPNKQSDLTEFNNNMKSLKNNTDINAIYESAGFFETKFRAINAVKGCIGINVGSGSGGNPSPIPTAS